MDDLSSGMNILWWKADGGTGGSCLWQWFEVRQEDKKTRARRLRDEAIMILQIMMASVTKVLAD